MRKISILQLGILLLLTVLGTAQAVEIGQPIPDFSSKTASGKEFSLKRTLATHRGALVVFVGTKCSYSNQYAERLRELSSQLEEKGVALLAVNSNASESLPEIKKQAADQGFSFPVLIDPKAAIADRFGAQKTPETYLVSKEGKVLYQGRIDDDAEGKQIDRRDALAAVDEFLAGKPISVTKTKAFGCQIERGSVEK